ncbi:MAG: DEAD/DEAH box helicase [Anaerolineales bacterium]|nr:DEAD/DEAH box helicase [Anaerolineales bacterium]
MSLQSLFANWRTDPDTAPNLPTWRTTPPRPANLNPFPADLPPALAEALTARGITSLYSHQAEVWEHARAGENVVLATGTASGKTLGYNLPVLSALLEDDDARALYLFPTKALAQDQFSVISHQCSVLEQTLKTEHWTLNIGIYDGDTPQSHRAAIRQKSRIILTNPDMLHTGILPHHTNWGDFFRNLKFIVIDEMHTYRGVFGSHVANVIRRLKRVARFYGANPQFILTSATIGNPQELAGRLIEEPVVLIDNDGSSRGERHFLICNPPVVDPALGLRKSSLLESVRLAQDMLAYGVQSVVFARSRRSVEIILRYLNEGQDSQAGNQQSQIRGYRSGYLPSQRREIEKGLRDGNTRLVVATNALELGIDIGGLGAAILVGYPGTIASTWQQAGRAGRGDEPAAAVLVATASPLDQFLAHHPEYFFARSPEQALVNPDHLLILLNHLRCALFELPFQKGETFGGQPVEDFLEFLVSSREVHLSQDKYFWMADSYPAAAVSLRSASPENVVLQANTGGQPRTIGEVDFASAFWMVHPKAVYLHEGQQFFVQELDLESNTATLIPVGLDYYTEPLRETSVQVLSVIEQSPHPPSPSPDLGRGGAGGEGCSKSYGELQVTTQVTGFRKRMWLTGENLGEEPLDLPPTELQTTGYWLSLSEQTVETLRNAGAWTNDPNQYGPDWPRLRERVRARDGYCCAVCGAAEDTLSGAGGRQHDVHHKTPFRSFLNRSATTPIGAKQSQEASHSVAARANQMDNLITLCPACHRKAEANVRMKSGLAGLAYVLGQLAPLFLMCDSRDLGVHADLQAAFADGQPAVVIYDNVPAGIGFSQKLFEMHDELLARALELVTACECEDGCPSCVGPGGENGAGGKRETVEIVKLLVAGGLP